MLIRITRSNHRYIQQFYRYQSLTTASRRNLQTKKQIHQKSSVEKENATDELFDDIDNALPIGFSTTLRSLVSSSMPGSHLNNKGSSKFIETLSRFELEEKYDDTQTYKPIDSMWHITDRFKLTSPSSIRYLLSIPIDTRSFSEIHERYLETTNLDDKRLIRLVLDDKLSPIQYFMTLQLLLDNYHFENAAVVAKLLLKKLSLDEQVYSLERIMSRCCKSSMKQAQFLTSLLKVGFGANLLKQIGGCSFDFNIVPILKYLQEFNSTMRFQFIDSLEELNSILDEITYDGLDVFGRRTIEMKKICIRVEYISSTVSRLHDRFEYLEQVLNESGGEFIGDGGYMAQLLESYISGSDNCQADIDKDIVSEKKIIGRLFTNRLTLHLMGKSSEVSDYVSLLRNFKLNELPLKILWKRYLNTNQVHNKDSRVVEAFASQILGKSMIAPKKRIKTGNNVKQLEQKYDYVPLKVSQKQHVYVPIDDLQQRFVSTPISAFRGNYSPISMDNLEKYFFSVPMSDFQVEFASSSLNELRKNRLGLFFVKLYHDSFEQHPRVETAEELEEEIKGELEGSIAKELAEELEEELEEKPEVVSAFTKHLAKVQSSYAFDCVARYLAHYMFVRYRNVPSSYTSNYYNFSIYQEVERYIGPTNNKAFIELWELEFLFHSIGNLHPKRVLPLNFVLFLNTILGELHSTNIENSDLARIMNYINRKKKDIEFHEEVWTYTFIRWYNHLQKKGKVNARYNFDRKLIDYFATAMFKLQPKVECYGKGQRKKFSSSEKLSFDQKYIIRAISFQVWKMNNPKFMTDMLDAWVRILSEHQTKHSRVFFDFLSRSSIVLSIFIKHKLTFNKRPEFKYDNLIDLFDTIDAFTLKKNRQPKFPITTDKPSESVSLVEIKDADLFRLTKSLLQDKSYGAVVIEGTEGEAIEFDEDTFAHFDSYTNELMVANEAVDIINDGENPSEKRLTLLRLNIGTLPKFDLIVRFITENPEYHTDIMDKLLTDYNYDVPLSLVHAIVIGLLRSRVTSLESKIEFFKYYEKLSIMISENTNGLRRYSGRFNMMKVELIDAIILEAVKTNRGSLITLAWALKKVDNEPGRPAKEVNSQRWHEQISQMRREHTGFFHPDN
ncbi:hypothetical protein CANARDRAFT_21845 [[Candida] arabinofermentans NRRL YB-2248]|uniref:Uncharacterized protein n=1 Tax=[Candida] arabinofermentans NRRL YB-2248 TaxID=983967 RepID=A0A1E4T516_9ASCO|nr:hypothetical protein CANARDRAFT_21845 [[Candida] arabinofermentans NRRL YB-2248]